MWTARFDPKEREIWVRVRIHGTLGTWDVECLLDTGTSITIISSAVLDSLGYGAHMGKTQRDVIGPGGVSVPGYTIDVALELMGLRLRTHEVLAQDILPDTYGVEGLIGMDVVEGRLLTIDGRVGTVRLEE